MRPSSSSRRSVSVSTRDTKKLATEMTSGGIAALLDEALEPTDVRLGDLRVAGEREDQRDVDRAAARDAVLDRAEARLGPGIFT